MENKMLITVEAEYHNGVLELKEKPANVQNAKAIVTFLSEDPTEEEKKATTLKAQAALKKIQDLLKDIPLERSLAEELIAERRKAAENE